MFRKLRGRIVEYYGTLGEFAKAVGISRTMLWKYMRGKASLNAKTMEKWGGLLEIPRSEYGNYFFAD